MRCSKSGLIVALFIGGLCCCNAQSSAQLVAPSSGKAMCSALTPADFTKVGVPVSRLRTVNLDNEQSAYCIYESTAGNVEFDIFNPAGDSAEDAKNAERAASAAIGGSFVPVHVTGADDAQTNAARPNKGSAGIVARRGEIMFNIIIPQSTKAEQQLVALAEVTLSRLKQ